MAIKDLQNAANLFRDWKDFQEVQATLQNVVTYYQARIEYLKQSLSENPEFQNLTPEELKYLTDITTATEEAKDKIKVPVSPDATPVEPDSIPDPIKPLEKPEPLP